VNARPALDVSHLPAYAFGPRGLMWWGTMGLLTIEGTMFAILIATYFYLRIYVPEWPPHSPPPDLFYGTANTLVLLISVVPNQWVKGAAERQDLRGVRISLLICPAFSAAFLTLRAFEFLTLNCHWDTNAYGSIVWAIMGFHTFHLFTDALDSAVLTGLMFTRRIEGARFVDVSENAVYWYFVVGAWLPLYAVVYFAPRLL
jgi:cytochrome c oxidase subunit III